MGTLGRTFHNAVFHLLPPHVMINVRRGPRRNYTRLMCQTLQSYKRVQANLLVILVLFMKLLLTDLLVFF